MSYTVTVEADSKDEAIAKATETGPANRKYVVTFVRYGFAEVEAISEDGAFAKAEGMGAEDIDWSDSFEISATEETDF